MGRKVVDLTGRKFGMLLVLRDSGDRRKSEVMWNCRCDCGVEKLVRGGNLKQGKAKSCGCNKDHYKLNAINATVDHAGKRFGRLIVLRQESQGKLGGSLWVCECDCGRSRVFAAKGLVAGSTTSCGCAQRDAVTKHGLSYHPLYRIWTSMMARCHDSNNPAFKWYGGRGVEVCVQWRATPQQFFDDMGERPEGTSIDRIDGTGGYSKKNCRWATNVEQSNNRSNNRWFLFLGDVYNMKQLCKFLDVGYSAVSMRLHRGLSASKSFGVNAKEINYDQAMQIKFN